jgi:uncharacterized protein YkwD
LRQVLAAVLAIPVIIAICLGSLLRRSHAGRIGAAVAIGSVIGIAALGGSGTQPTTATAPGVVVPLTSVVFSTNLKVDQDVDAAIAISFSTPMDAASVAAHLELDPPTPVGLRWDAAGRTLTITPAATWAPGRFHTITVQPGALALTGRPLSVATRAAFLTRPPASGRIVPTELDGERVTPATAFILEFDRPIDPLTMIGALAVSPPMDGILAPTGQGDDRQWTFTPAAPLLPDTIYTLSLSDAVRDIDGSALAESVVVSVRTAPAPRVLRFRPRDGQKEIERESALSVRFTEPMDHASTRAAFRVTADGVPVTGTVSFAEGDTVLVFRPAAALGFGQSVVRTVGTTARSTAGVPLAVEARGTFTTEPTPAPPKPPAAPPPPSGGGTVGSGSWAAVETYYLKLMNCTRTGGLVTSTGSCSSPGGRDVAPLMLDAGISSKVSRPYAKLLATQGLCSHFIGGSPADRLRRAGYTSYNWAENLGCRSGDPFAAVLGSHLYFQGERNWSPQGGHYVNMMNAKYDRAGIGVWVASGRVRLVVSFYRP